MEVIVAGDESPSNAGWKIPRPGCGTRYPAPTHERKQAGIATGVYAPLGADWRAGLEGSAGGLS